MPSARRINWPQNKPKALEIRGLRIQCKALRAWTSRVLARLRRIAEGFKIPKCTINALRRRSGTQGTGLRMDFASK
jgi:hypothetical protein